MRYILLSSAMFLAGHYFPYQCYVLMFLFLVPLFMRATQARLTFKEGMIWGALTFGVHSYWLASLLLTQAAGCIGLIAWVLAVSWCSILSGIWFYGIFCSQLLATVCFWWLIAYDGGLFFYLIDGYPIFSPLTVCAARPELLWFLFWIGSIGLLVCLVGVQVQLAQLIIRPSYRSLLRCILFSIPFGVGFLMYQNIDQHYGLDLGSMHYVQPTWYGCTSSRQAGYGILDAIYKTSLDHPEVETLLMPESSFCFDMSLHEYWYDLWSQAGKDLTIIWGTHRVVHGSIRNSIFIMRGGSLLFIYDKQHLMPVIEKKFPLWSCYVHKVFGNSEMLEDAACDRISDARCDDLIDVAGTCYQIFVCSELFFQAKRVKGYPILFFFNESWLSRAYGQQLAMLFIDYYKMKYRVPIIYMSTLGRHNILNF